MNHDPLHDTLSHLVSEQRNPDTMDIDLLPSLEILKRINQQDKLVPLAVAKVLPEIALAVDKISEAFRQGGRLIYIGAGSSGRLGIVDASECPPTFGVDADRVIGVIAGGPEAMLQAREGAEDAPEDAVTDLKRIKLNHKDVLVGIAASGRTPYVIGALKYADTLGTTTVALSCNPDSEIAAVAQIAITPIVGPEALTGSTRLKSGSAQKLVLNMLSTAAMIRQGKCYQNLMVDMKASNKKLKARAQRIVMQATDCGNAEAGAVLEETDYEVKTAILILLTGLDKTGARLQLKQHNGFLRRAVERGK